MTTPDFIRVGQWIKVLDWCGRIADIARSETKVMVQVQSFKGVWNHHPTEWLEYKDGWRAETAAGASALPRNSLSLLAVQRLAMTVSEFLTLRLSPRRYEFSRRV
jgi:hypothetical protein